MLLRSSIHIFTTISQNVIKGFTSERATPQEMRTELSNYFMKISRMREQFAPSNLEEIPLHARDRNYIKEYLAACSEYMPPFVVQRIFEQRGIALNIFGDILTAPHVVSVLSSRVFSCAGAIDDPASRYLVQSASTRFRRKVISYSLACEGVKIPECRIYFADGKQISCLRRSSIPGNCEELAPELLPRMWPEVDWASILTETDMMAFSDKIRDIFQIPVDENMIGYQFLRAEGLYNIYQKG